MKVKFSKSSWHHRLFDYTYNSEPPQYLCAYFWLIVLAVLLIPLSAIGSIWYIFDGRIDTDPPRPLLGVFTSAIVLTIIGTLIGLFMIGSIVLHSAPTMTALSILTAIVLGGYFSRDLWVPFLKASYKRVCPFIDWSDEE